MTDHWISEEIDRVIGRLPRAVAYPLIAAVCLVIGIPIGFALGAILRLAGMR